MLTLACTEAGTSRLTVQRTSRNDSSGKAAVSRPVVLQPKGCETPFVLQSWSFGLRSMKRSRTVKHKSAGSALAPRSAGSWATPVGGLVGVCQ